MKVFLIALSVFLIIGCAHGYDDDYTYIWDIEVTYLNGDLDTLHFERNSFKGNPVSMYLKIEEPGILADAGTSPTLVSSCGFYDWPLVSGIRKFKILNHEKEGPLPFKSYNDPQYAEAYNTMKLIWK